MTARTITSNARRTAVAALAALTAALTSACGSDTTAPIDAQDQAALAASTFSHRADSVSRNGGDADVGTAYSGIAGVLRAGGRIGPITLTIDGTATTFMAAGWSVETTVNDCPPGAQCFVPPSKYQIRNLIAWDKDNPKRIVQLSSTSNDEKIGAIFDPSPLALYARMATLVYMDGAGGTYIGTSGSQKIDVTKSGTACPLPADSAKIVAMIKNNDCVLADLSIGFDGKVEPSPFVVTGNTAKGTHSIAMSAQSVPGTHRTVTIVNMPCDEACKPPVDSVLPPPPLPVRPTNELAAKLSAVVNGDVTLTFTVTNPSKDPAKLVFPTGQKYDFVVIDSTTGKEAWRWSTGRGFTQAIVEQTVPAGGSVSFTEKFTPAPKKRYLAHARLTSTSHRAEAYAAFLTP